MAYYSTRRASTAQSATSTRRLLVGSIATSLCTVVVDGVLAGSAFTHRWQHSEEGSSTTVCWITQLVVHKSYRGRGLASGLLGLVRSGSDGVYGIISSHPAACLAAAKSFGTSMSKVDLGFVKAKAPTIVKASPASYVRNAELRGAIFESANEDGLISGVKTNFFVDHEEPLKALASIEEEMDWPLGRLPDGHEYLLILRNRHASRGAVMGT